MYLWLILRRPFPSTFIHLFFNLSCLQNAWPEIRPRRLGNTPPPLVQPQRSGRAAAVLASSLRPLLDPGQEVLSHGAGGPGQDKGRPCSLFWGRWSSLGDALPAWAAGGGLRGAPSCPQKTRPCRHGEGGRSRTGGQQVSARSRPTGPVDCPRSGAGCTPSWSP